MGWSQSGQQAIGVRGQVFPPQPALALGRAATAQGQQSTQPRVGTAVGDPDHQRPASFQVQLGADQQLQLLVPRGRMRADHARQAVLVGDRQRLISQLDRAVDQFVRMGRSEQEREVRLAVQFGVTHGRPRRSWLSVASRSRATCDARPVRQLK
jgi:hypothetical protein